MAPASTPEIGDRAAGDDLAAIDDGDALAPPLRFLEVVRREHDRHTGPLELGQHLVDPLPALRINADRRLVEQDELRLMHEAAGDVEPAAHAAGEALDGLARSLDEIRPLERPRDARGQVGFRNAVQPAEHLEVLARREQRIDRHLLGHDADLRTAIPGGQRPSQQVNRAGVEPHLPRDRLDHRCLARAVRAEQADELTAMHFEERTGERLHLAKALGRVVDEEHGRMGT